MEFAQNKRVKLSRFVLPIIFTSKNALIDSHFGRWRMILHWNTPKTLSAKKRWCPERTIKQNERFDGTRLPTYANRLQLLRWTMRTRWHFYRHSFTTPAHTHTPHRHMQWIQFESGQYGEFRWWICQMTLNQNSNLIVPCFRLNAQFYS